MATRLAPPQRPAWQRARPLLVFVNANASGLARPGTSWPEALLRLAGARAEVVATESVGELAAAWPVGDEQRVVLVGGDGTVHAAANLPGPRPELALIPTGRANNVARSLGIPAEPRAAARLAVEGTSRPVDAIEATTDESSYVCVEGVSVGFLALARTRYRAANSGALLRGVAAGAGALARFRPLGVDVRHDGTRERLRLAQLFVANLPLYEFGLRVAPHADPEDALLDFVGVEGGGRHSIPAMLARLKTTGLLGRPGVHLWRAPRARITTHGTSPIVADSTDLGFGPVELAALPAALRIVAPPR
ncbi:MAG: hypothetical protein ICV64_01830 [Thermoleophilia bacterium]|nr:hypothetical protein [Thermoleophilia bacterium]